MVWPIFASQGYYETTSFFTHVKNEVDSVLLACEDGFDQGETPICTGLSTSRGSVHCCLTEYLPLIANVAVFESLPACDATLHV